MVLRLAVVCLFTLLMNREVQAQGCYPNKNFYYFVVKTSCKEEGSCCKNNFECESACCDPYTQVCMGMDKAEHFLENYPYSTACMETVTKDWAAVEKILDQEKVCRLKREYEYNQTLIKVLVPIGCFLLLQIAGISFGIGCIYCRLKKRNKKEELSAQLQQEKLKRMMKKEDEVDPLEVIMRLKKDSKVKDLDFTYMIWPKEEIITPDKEDQAEHPSIPIPKMRKIDPDLELDLDGIMKNGDSQNEDLSMDKPKPGKMPIKIKDPLEPRNPPDSQTFAQMQKMLKSTSIGGGGGGDGTNGDSSGLDKSKLGQPPQLPDIPQGNKPLTLDI